jgi:hypothetical protein
MITREYAFRVFNAFESLLSRACLILKNEPMFGSYSAVLAAHLEVA